MQIRILIIMWIDKKERDSTTRIGKLIFEISIGTKFFSSSYHLLKFDEYNEINKKLNMR